jgi:hypothetical protein
MSVMNSSCSVSKNQAATLGNQLADISIEVKDGMMYEAIQNHAWNLTAITTRNGRTVLHFI